MSNNPLLPPPDMDDFEATMIREENPPVESLESIKAKGLAEIQNYYESERAKIAPPVRTRARPRRAKRRNIIWTYIALGGYFAIACFTGTLLANIL